MPSLREWKSGAGSIVARNTGSIVSDRTGAVTTNAMMTLQERMNFFVKPGDAVYEGMVVGENSRADDMDVNITKEKKLNNIRSSTAEELERLTPPQRSFPRRVSRVRPRRRMC